MSVRSGSKILSRIRFQTQRCSIRRFTNAVTPFSLAAWVGHQFHSAAKTFWPEASSFDSHVSTTTLRLFCHCDAEKLPKPLHPEYFTVTELPLDFYIRDVILLKRQNSKNAFSPRPPRGPGQHCSQFTDDTGLHYLSRLFQIKFNIHVFSVQFKKINTIDWVCCFPAPSLTLVKILLNLTKMGASAAQQLKFRLSWAQRMFWSLFGWSTLIWRHCMQMQKV